MKKTTPVLSLLTTLLWGQALHAETYTYTGPNFTDVAGGYTASMSVTASITTSAPIPPNETGYDIIPLVTNWSMSDGVNTLQNGPDSYLYALVDTDSAGHIVGGLIGATYALSVPPLIGDTVDEITIRSNPPTNIGVDDKLCTADDGEQCTSYDSSASFGWVEGYGTWTGDHVFEDGFEDLEISYSIDFCRLQVPLEIVQTPGTQVDVYGRLYIAGLTDSSAGNDPAPEVIGYVGYGPDGSDPSSGWFWVAGIPNPGYSGEEENNDEYLAKLTVPDAGNYDFAFRFSGDGSLTFTYCDGGDAGSSNGYLPSDAGHMTSAP